MTSAAAVAMVGRLKLNISESDNSQDVELAMQVSEFFRVTRSRAIAIADEVAEAVRDWRSVSSELRISRAEQDDMAVAFRCAEK